MRTHVELDETALQQVMALGRYPSKKAAVNSALVELVRALKRKKLLSLRGKVRWEGDLDALRRRRA
jgi:Arc/MetJ family transcription regulator